ncbi:uncharacterized protein LOC142544109 [Primulina tabacum]|uniref:uncharacterized protein LOC142544109 n=1 Tax=Primulina tabacum TaxID=48773 RepID=UPI003F5A25FD
MSNQERKRKNNILSFFQPRIDNPSSSERIETHASINIEEPGPPSKSKKVVFDESSLERDPELRISMLQHPVNHRDEIRRAYIKMGPYQPKLSEYPRSESGKQHRRFQYTWFKKFPWLEYSPSKDAVFCFPCYLFELSEAQQSTFTIEGFRSWKRVNNGAKCAFLSHMGSSNSTHNKSSKSVVDLMNVIRHIDKVMNRESSEQIQKNRLRLTATIGCVHWLSLQACGLRGHDESSYSQNRGNFIEMLKLLGKWNASIGDVILDKAPGNARYTSPEVQKEILHIIAKDVSNKEQMAIILRFVNAYGFLRERFFQIVHVHDTTAATLKKEICDVLTIYNLEIHNMRGQGYDGASNMSGAFNGLQALFLKDCPYAYYVHCFAHRLQLALVAAAEKEISIWLFFSNLTTIVNLVTSSSKRNAGLQSCQVNEIARSIVVGERETGRGANQIGTLQRVGTTRWSSHFDSILSLIDMYDATINVLENIIIDGTSTSMRGEAGGSLIVMKLDVDISEMSSHYKHSSRSCQKKDTITVEHHFHYDIFNVAIDFQLEELNSRFSDETVELLILSSALDPKDNFKWFNIDKICILAEKYYPEDFTGQEMHHLSCQLQHFELDVVCHEDFQKMSTISELCRGLFETKKLHYNLIYKLIRLVLTLPVSTATTERAFSAMNHVKTVFRGKMGDCFLTDSMIIYIEREFSSNIDSDSIIDEYYTSKNRRSQLQ